MRDPETFKVVVTARENGRRIHFVKEVYTYSEASYLRAYYTQKYGVGTVKVL